ncbi:MAG: disulfide bond formation protein B [Steroidobacteraceae bacterium]
MNPLALVGWLAARRRRGNLAGFLACAGMMGYALYAQNGLGLDPCPLCMFQRVGIITLGVVFLLAALHDPRSTAGARTWGVLITVAALLPVGVAGRHVWIQSQPPGSVPSWGATLDYMLEVFPLLTVVRKVLGGGGECARIDWTFLGLSMPAWVLIAALVLGAWGLWVNWRRAPQPGLA